MGLIDKKVADADRALEVIRERAMQLRQLERALKRLHFEDLSEEIDGIAEDLIDESKTAKQALDTIIAEVIAEQRCELAEGSTKPDGKEEGKEEGGKEEVAEAAGAKEEVTAPIAAAAGGHFGA